jgi:hypothetical protein
VATYELVESSPGDKYLPSCLILARHPTEAFHVLFAVDVQGDNVRAVTAYRPDPAEWQPDLKTGGQVDEMRCLWSRTRALTTDLPFKVREPGIVILKGVPVLQCARCPRYLLRDDVLARVDEILRGVDTEIELEVVRDAA